MFQILEKTMLCPTIAEIVVKAPRVAKTALPGQFLIIRDEEKGERIPLTISDSDPVRGTVTIVIQLIGASSHNMVERFSVGDSYADVVGPLGNPSDFVTMTRKNSRSSATSSSPAVSAPPLSTPRPNGCTSTALRST